MHYKLVYTKTFENDLDSVLDYVVNNLFNPAAA